MLAVTGGKGGVGKTTVALGLAEALGRRGSAAVVVDADRDMPDLHRVSGVPQQPGVGALADGAAFPAATHTPEGRQGVRIVPLDAGTDLCTVRTALERARMRGESVLVDCPAGAGPDAALPLRLADEAVLVATPTPASLRDAAKTAAMARALDAPPVGVVCTRAEETPPAEGLLDCPVVGCVPETRRPLELPAARAAYRSCVTATTNEPGRE